MGHSRKNLNPEHSEPTVEIEIKTIRKMSEKKYAQLDANYYSVVEQINSLNKEIEDVSSIIKTQKIQHSTDNGKVVQEIAVSPAGIAGFRKKKTELRLKLKLAKKQLEKTEKRYKSVSFRNNQAIRNQIRKLNEKEDLARFARKNQENYKGDVLKLINSLKESKGDDYKALSSVAIDRGIEFRKIFNALIKNNMADKYRIISANSQVKTEIIRAVRSSFGWKSI